MSQSYNTAETYVIPAAAAGGLEINQRSRFIYIAAASENLNIRISDEDNNQVGSIKNFPAGLGQPFPDGFSRAIVTTASGAAGAASLCLGTDMSVFTMLTGTVNILDQTSPRAVAVHQLGFSAGFNQNGVAGQYSRLQLRNPAGSGVNILLVGADLFSAAASSFNISMAATVADLGALILGVANRYAGAAAPVGVFSRDTNPAQFSPTPQLFIAVPAGMVQSPDFDSTMLVVPPGYALQIANSGLNNQINGNLYSEEWRVGSI